MTRRKFVWHHVLILLPAILVFPYADSANLIDSCNCTMYDDEYMYCNCCPIQATPGYAFRFDYSYVDLWNGPTDRLCEGERSSVSSRRCDCVFCGYIKDTSNPFYNTCKDMNLSDRDFMRSRTYEINITYSDEEENIDSFHYEVTADNTIMLPSPVTIETMTSFLLPNDSVTMDIRWKPHDEFTQLIYTVTWHPLGDSTSEVTAQTSDRNITLVDLIPNVQYVISITCLHPSSIYESKSAEKVVLSAERKPDRPPELVNFQINSNDCENETNCNMMVFWKPLPKEHQSANCTGYAIDVLGPDGEFSQLFDCDDVMGLIREPLSRELNYDISLTYLSGVGPSPPSYLNIPALKEETLERPQVIIERNSSHVSARIRWDNQGTPPAIYDLLYCYGTAIEKCQGSLMQERITANNDGSATFWIDNPGYEFLYNVAPYWENQTPGLDETWLCVFDVCGDLVKPVVSLGEVQKQESLSLIVREDGCSAVQRDRGRPLFYEIEVIHANTSEVVRNDFVEAFGPVTLNLPHLNPDQVYLVRVRSQGHCDCNQSPGCQYSPFDIKSFKTQEAPAFKFPVWAIAVVVVSILLLMSGAVAAGGHYYHRRTKHAKKELEDGLKVGTESVISSVKGQRTRDWLNTNDFTGTDSDDYGQLDTGAFVYESASEADSGIHDSDVANGVCKCVCIPLPWRKVRNKGSPSIDQEKQNRIGNGIRMTRASLPSVPSQDSGHSGDTSMPGTPTTQEIMPNATGCPAVATDIVRDKRLSDSPADGNQTESGIMSYACQASPMSSANGPLANDSSERDAVVQPAEPNTSITAQAINGNDNADGSGTQPEFSECSTDAQPQGFIPRGVLVPGFDALRSETKETGENTNNGVMCMKGNSDYVRVADLNDSTNSSFDSDTSEEMSDCSSEAGDDSKVSFAPTVANLSALLKSGFPINGAKDNGIKLPTESENNMPKKNPLVAVEELIDSSESCQSDLEGHSKSVQNNEDSGTNGNVLHIVMPTAEDNKLFVNISGSKIDDSSMARDNNNVNGDSTSPYYQTSSLEDSLSQESDEDGDSPVTPVVVLPTLPTQGCEDV